MELLTGLVIGIIIGYLIGRRVWMSKKIEGTRSRVEEGKDKIMELFNNEAEISNNDVEKLLGVSDSTATRYLDDLEKEGRIRQIGTTGRGVTYKRT